MLFMQLPTGNYAHGKHELKPRHATLYGLEKSGVIANARTHLARPCLTWVSTGACPFGPRCGAIHDPSVSATPDRPAWLPAASSKTSAPIVVDRLACHREGALHQENPLVSQNIWEHCRPSEQRGGRTHGAGGARSDRLRGEGVLLDVERVWSDTCALVCNSGVPAFAAGRAPASTLPRKLSDLQRLCIVHVMRGGDGPFQQGEYSSRLHRDFVFSPTHALCGELCMVLQARYFLLLQHPPRSACDIVKEISFEEYQARTTPWSAGYPFDPRRCATAHEVAFAPKGDHGANVSIWFDARPVELEEGQVKRRRRLKQRRKSRFQDYVRPNANGALICRTSPFDFPAGPPDVDPFVPMLPATDHEDVHGLLMAIVEHRIDSIILDNCSSINEDAAKMMHLRTKRLRQIFMGMLFHHQKWVWPKREGMDCVTSSTKAPPCNAMPYAPPKNRTRNCLHAWHSFVRAIGAPSAQDNVSPTNHDTKRLGVFLSFSESTPASLPHILSRANAKADNSSNEDDTWKEIILGCPKDGKWGAAQRLYKKKREGIGCNAMWNVPLSTTAFVQA